MMNNKNISSIIASLLRVGIGREYWFEMYGRFILRAGPSGARRGIWLGTKGCGAQYRDLANYCETWLKPALEKAQPLDPGWSERAKRRINLLVGE
jgi:hypothetical protein